MQITAKILNALTFYLNSRGTVQSMDNHLEQLRGIGLTTKQLVCLTLYYFDCLRMPEIAKRLKIRKQVVFVHIHTGLRKIKKLGLPIPIRNERDNQQGRIMLMGTDTVDGLTANDIQATW